MPGNESDFLSDFRRAMARMDREDEAARVTVVLRVADQLLAYGQVNSEQVREWARLREVAEQLKNELRATAIPFEGEASHPAKDHHQGMATLLRNVRRDMTLPGYPRLWDLLGYVFMASDRARRWTPAMEVMKRDHNAAMKQYKSRWARRWLVACFAFQTIVLFLRTWAGVKYDRWLPAWLRKWIAG